MPRPPIITRRTRHVPAGVYLHKCPRCEREFRTDEPRTVYCSDRCEKAAANARYYERKKIAQTKRTTAREEAE